MQAVNCVLSRHWEDEFLSIPCSSPGNPCCDRRRGRSPFTHERRHRLSSSSDLSPAEENACVCTLLPLLYFLCRLLFVHFLLFSRVAVFPPKYLSLPPAPSLPLPSFLSQPSPQKKTPYHWLPWDPVAMRQRGFHMVLACVRVYCSVTESRCCVDWEEEEECWVRMWGLETSCCLVGPKTLNPYRNTQTLTP